VTPRASVNLGYVVSLTCNDYSRWPGLRIEQATGRVGGCLAKITKRDFPDTPATETDLLCLAVRILTPSEPVRIGELS
jgi:hypothetical protein